MPPRSRITRSRSGGPSISLTLASLRSFAGSGGSWGSSPARGCRSADVCTGGSKGMRHAGWNLVLTAGALCHRRRGGAAPRGSHSRRCRRRPDGREQGAKYFPPVKYKARHISSTSCLRACVPLEAPRVKYGLWNRAEAVVCPTSMCMVRCEGVAVGGASELVVTKSLRNPTRARTPRRPRVVRLDHEPLLPTGVGLFLGGGLLGGGLLLGLGLVPNRKGEAL